MGGGGGYDRDVSTTDTRVDEIFTTRGSLSDEDRRRGVEAVASILDPKGKVRESCDLPEKPRSTPIVIGLDLTDSGWPNAKIVYDKLPRLMGVLHKNPNLATNPQVCFMGIGDARQGDTAPLQVSQFESDNRLDVALSKLRLEGGGGGNGRESYELAAFMAARRMKLDAWDKRKQKGFFFIVGDEMPYDEVSAQDVLRILGVDIKKDTPTAQIFRELQEKFHAFFIYPKTDWAAQKTCIDEEIKKRLIEAGGRFKDVDVRISLDWHNTTDLDLHVVCPSGEEICYSHKHSECGGELDVDRNVNGETMKPIENIRWPKGKAPHGRYKVIVQTYRDHGMGASTPFRVETDVNGEIKHFDMKSSSYTRVYEGEPKCNVKVCEFDYYPAEKGSNKKDKYADYARPVVIEKWSTLIPPENILEISQPRSCVDAMIGAITLVTGTETLDAYLENLGKPEAQGGVGQTAARCKDVREALTALAESGVKKEVSGNLFPSKTKKSRRIAD